MTELQEQLRDVMFYLEAKEKLEASDEVTQQELQEGQIVVQSSSAVSSAAPSGSGRKPRKKGRWLIKSIECIFWSSSKVQRLIVTSVFCYNRSYVIFGFQLLS